MKVDPPPYNIIKLNVDVARAKGKTSMVILAWNLEDDVIGLWYDNYKCTYALVVELLEFKMHF